MERTELICLRHAEAEPVDWESLRDITGGDAPPDPPLTQKGRRQARTVAHRLMRKRPQKVFVSKALRSRETGTIIASHMEAEIEVVPSLAEISMAAAITGRENPACAMPFPLTVSSEGWRVQWPDPIESTLAHDEI